MFRSLGKVGVVASVCTAMLVAMATDASAGHRHRRAKSNTNACCCGGSVAPVAYTSSYSG
ncbi:MAG: hypothetical protein IT423_04040, partial [Pirellulaceae bacterium]|nr:hypothetical protein [Pirellulaceae bacterium]